MTETEKFYVPEISEFHVGFEFEWKQDSDSDFEEHIQTIAPQHSFFSMNTEIICGNIRVRYLNHEDIVGEEWTKWGDKPNEYTYTPEEGMRWYLSHTPEENRVCVYLGAIMVFSGTILNINQLRTIMKMVGIKK